MSSSLFRKSSHRWLGMNINNVSRRLGMELLEDRRLLSGTWGLEAQLSATSPLPSNNPLGSLSLSEDTMVVGNFGNSVPGSGFGGSARVFERTGTVWTEAATLTSSEGLVSFASVAIDGDVVVVGNGFDGAYVFIRPASGWVDATESAKLIATDGTPGNRAGNSVAILGDTVIVGAKNNDDAGFGAGAAYVFTKPAGGWVDAAAADAKLTASDAAAGNSFGEAVSVSGDTIVVGADGGTGSIQITGGAYVFEKPLGGWGDATEDAKLTNSDGVGDDTFGARVSIFGDTIVVGALASDNVGQDSGTAYVFEMPSSGWVDANEDAKLVGSNTDSFDLFGSGVSIWEGTIVVGAEGNEDGGAAYVFRKPSGGWADATEDSRLCRSEAVPPGAGGFGAQVSISGDTIGVGTYDPLRRSYVFREGVDTCEVTVEIDIHPQNLYKNGPDDPYNLNSNAKVEIGVMSTPTFDATTLHISSVAAGDPKLTPRITAQSSWTGDFNNDGLLDIAFDFGAARDFSDAGALNANSNAIQLSGSTTSGQQVVGTDFGLTIVGGGSSGGDTSVALLSVVAVEADSPSLPEGDGLLANESYQPNYATPVAAAVDRVLETADISKQVDGAAEDELEAAIDAFFASSDLKT